MMLHKRILLAFLLLFCMVTTAAADPLPPARQIDWSQAGIPGGIPAVAAGGSVVDYGAIPDDGLDDTAAFQAAIDAQAGTAAHAITIPAGTFHINTMLTINDSIVLRGVSPAETILKLGTTGRAIDIVTYQRGDWTAVTDGASKGSTSVTVADASQFAVGGFFEIKQDNDPAVMYTDPQWEQGWAADAVGQLGVVTAINSSSNTLTLREPLHHDFDPALNIAIRDQGFVEYVGIENLHLDRSGLSGTSDETIQWKNAAYVWLDHVESSWTDEKHVSTDTVYRCEVRDSYLHDSYDFGGGGHGYGVELGFHTTGCLIENNIFHTLRHAMMVHLGANGNVFGYNYSFDAVSEDPDTWLPPDISLHGHFPYANLFEGNIVFEVGNGDFWGPSGPHNTFLRNCVTGEGLWYQDHSHDQNLIGNVILAGEFGQRSGDSSPITGIIEHGNYWNGGIQWDATIADQTLPDSYYWDGVPSFYAGLAYPSIVPAQPADCTNPARERWTAGNPFAAAVAITPTPSPTPDPNITPTATPLPTATPAVSIGTLIYADTVGNGWELASWGGTYTEVSDPLAANTVDQAWQVAFDTDWAALRFRTDDGSAFAFDAFEQICFDMYYADVPPGLILRAQFNGTYSDTNYPIEPQGAGAWHTYCYDLAGWQPNNFTQFDAVRIQDAGSGTQPVFYIDNVLLGDATSGTPLAVQLDTHTAVPQQAILLMVLLTVSILTVLFGILTNKKRLSEQLRS